MDDSGLAFEDQGMLRNNSHQLGPIDPKRSRFPCCVVWTPLPLISWLLPFIGHIGVCREDGVILDFAGPNFVCVDQFAFGKVTRYVRISREEVCDHLHLYFFSLPLLTDRHQTMKECSSLVFVVCFLSEQQLMQFILQQRKLRAVNIANCKTCGRLRNQNNATDNLQYMLMRTHLLLN